MTIQDWPVNYDELEPHYDHFDRVCGVSGKAGNLRGKKSTAAMSSKDRAATNIRTNRSNRVVPA